jgi:hypothetical protein
MLSAPACKILLIKLTLHGVPGGQLGSGPEVLSSVALMYPCNTVAYMQPHLWNLECYTTAASRGTMREEY